MAGQGRRAQLKRSLALRRHGEAKSSSLLIIAGASGSALQIIPHSRRLAGEQRCRTQSRVMAHEYLQEQFKRDEVLRLADIVVRAWPIRPFTRRRAVASDPT